MKCLSAPVDEDTESDLEDDSSVKGNGKAEKHTASEFVPAKRSGNFRLFWKTDHNGTVGRCEKQTGQFVIL